MDEYGEMADGACQRCQIGLAFLGHVDPTVGPAFPTLYFPAVLSPAGARRCIVSAATMPFYQLVCIAAHYPEYVSNRKI